MSRFTGRVAVVTGSARGIGAATAQRFAQEGAAVAVLDLDQDAASATAAGLGAERAVGVACDVSDAASVEAAVATVVGELGQLDILVNNAGVTRDNLLFKMSEDDWDMVMNVHLRGSFLMSREVQKHMVAAKYGKIVNLSSVSALGNRGQANYSAAKMGLQGFTRTLAIELGPFGVNVNAIAPGFIVTDMTDDTARRVGRGAGGVPQGRRRGQPRSAGSGTPRTSRPPRRSCAATRRPTSPARRCTSTAARRSDTPGTAPGPVPRPLGRLCHAEAHGASFPTTSMNTLEFQPRSPAAPRVGRARPDRRAGADRLHQQGRRRRTPGGQSVAKGLTVAGEWPLTGAAREGEGPEAPGDGRQDRQHRQQQRRSSGSARPT